MNSVKNVIDILMEIALSLSIAISSIGIIMLLISLIMNIGVFSYSGIFFFLLWPVIFIVEKFITSVVLFPGSFFLLWLGPFSWFLSQ